MTVSTDTDIGTLFIPKFNVGDEMINEKLRAEMNKAYEEADYKKALRLSQRLDKQILDEYKSKRDTIKEKENTSTMEI